MRLRIALAVSLTLHAALVASPGWLPGAKPARHELTVRLQKEELEELRVPEPRLAAAPPPLSLPRPPMATKPSRPNASAPRPLADEAAQAAREQIARELFYPLEAIEKGLEGEAVVMLFLDASGNAVAARLESSSGHALLDEAAVRAARTLRALPAGAPREALLPVRFRLR